MTFVANRVHTIHIYLRWFFTYIYLVYLFLFSCSTKKCLR